MSERPLTVYADICITREAWEDEHVRERLIADLAGFSVERHVVIEERPEGVRIVRVFGRAVLV